MRRNPLAQMLFIGVVLALVGIVIVLIIPWFPDKAARQAGNVRTLYDVLLIASVPMFALVLTVVGYSVWKFRMGPGQELKDGPPIHGNTRLEVIWTAVPAVLIVALCTYAYTVLRSNEDSKKNEMTVNVTERQFAFQFAYQQNGKNIVSPDLYLAQNQPVVLKLRSLDVIHSFFVPEFAEKLDAVPGITTTLRVTATRPGTYPAECTELCGAGHSLMRATVHVVTPQALQTWLSSQKPSAAPPVGSPPPAVLQSGAQGYSSPAGSSTSSGASSGQSSGASTSSSSGSSGAGASAAQGKAIFTGSAGCSGCHTLAAAGATGTTGPNLGSAIVPDAKKHGLSVKQFIFESITKPNAYISPGYQPNIMPQSFAQTLTPAQIQSLVSFVASATK